MKAEVSAEDSTDSLEDMMTNQPTPRVATATRGTTISNQSMPRAAARPAAKKDGTGWKVFIMVASLVATIGGWGILAVDQGQNVASAQTQIVQPASAPATTSQGNTGRQSSGLRQVTGPAVQPQTITRSRSSR